MNSLTGLVNGKIKNAMMGINKDEQLQSIIDPELLFRRNSINLYIGRRGSGKTYNVMREIIKLSHLKNVGGYNLFVYITDKTSDAAVNEMLGLVRLKTKVVSYGNAADFIQDLVSAKDAYNKVIENG
jgi:hypothetical protein